MRGLTGAVPVGTHGRTPSKEYKHTYRLAHPVLTTDRQLDEGNRNMAAAAHMVDLKPLPRNQRAGADEHAGQHRDMIEKVHIHQ